jgi:hypothetical protein
MATRAIFSVELIKIENGFWTRHLWAWLGTARQVAARKQWRDQCK